jgi:hypothetical protein
MVGAELIIDLGQLEAARVSVKLKPAMVFLSRIETAFSVPSRGCVVVPLALTDPDLRIKSGDVVQLRGPNGRLDARISAIERLTRRDKGCRLGLLLSGEIDCSQIGPDVEIWVEQTK